MQSTRVRRVRGRIAKILVCGLAIIGGGCTGSQPERYGPPFAGLEITLGAVGETAILDAVRAQAPEWESQTGATLKIREQPVNLDDTTGVDVLLFPGDAIGALVDRGLLAKFPEAAVRPIEVTDDDEPKLVDLDDLRARDPVDFNDVAQPYREQVTKYGDDRMALPLGGTALVLAMRRDAFQSEAARREAEARSINLAPPATWDELDALARFFQGRDINGDGAPDHGIAYAVMKDRSHLSVDTFLARAACVGQPLDQYALLFDAETMASRIAAPPFVEALAAWTALQECAPPDIARFDPSAARAAFREGKAAMLIDRAEFATEWTGADARFSVDVAALPAALRVYDPTRQVWFEPTRPNRVSYLPMGGGWMAAVAAATPDSKNAAAISLVQLLASPEVSQAVVSDPAFPMTPVRDSHLALGLPDPRAALGVDSRQWGVAVQQAFAAPRVVVGLRIPEADGYLDELADALTEAATKAKSAESALADTAKAWDKRSDRLGRARQLWHYRRSLNRFSTTSTPPSRE